ncbi:cyclophilin-like fold protein [Chloroflexota bacterium]
MSRTLQIKVNDIELEAVLNDTKTAEAIWEALPITGSINTWGDEVYFSISVRLEPEKGQEVVELGDLGYWPPGSAFCIFFGTTPASRGGEIRAASPVVIFGKVAGDATVLKGVHSGAQITIEGKTE